MPLAILAIITAEAGHEDTLRAVLEEIVAPTRSEAGCITYDLHVDNTQPGIFMFCETWETRNLWQDHMVSPHIKAHGQATKGMVAHVALHEMNQIA